MQNLFTNPVLYWTIMPLLTLASIIVFGIFVVKINKNNKGVWIGAIISGILSLQILPLFFELQSISYIDTKNFTVKNEKGYINNLQNIIRTTIYPAQKGEMYRRLGEYYGSKNLPLAVENYDKMRKYINCSSNNICAMPALTYFIAGEFEKLFEIADASNTQALAANACLIERNYSQALEYINKAIADKPDASDFYGTRAAIYRNIGKNSLANKDYTKALQLCKNKQCIERIHNRYTNYKTFAKDDWERMRKTFIQHGGIL